jgi:hypothetical protein
MGHSAIRGRRAQILIRFRHNCSNDSAKKKQPTRLLKVRQQNIASEHTSQADETCKPEPVKLGNRNGRNLSPEANEYMPAASPVIRRESKT